MTTIDDFRTPESQAEEKKGAAAMLVETQKLNGVASIVDVDRYSKLLRLVRDSFGQKFCKEFTDPCGGKTGLKAYRKVIGK